MMLAELSERFSIPSKLLEAAGVRHATDMEVRELLGIQGYKGEDLSGILFPYHDPQDGQVLSHRLRLDTPLPDGQKYISEQGCRVLFFPLTPSDDLADVDVPVVFVEAEKSSLALMALGIRCGRKFLPIAIGGVWGWRRKVATELTADGHRESVTGPSPSFDLVAWQGRKAVIAFDSNVAGRLDLEKARLALATELGSRGAQVLIASTPKRRGANGPDDVIALLGDKAALEMLDRAAPLLPARALPRPAQTGFLLSHLGDLLKKPETPVNWVLENVLLVGGVSGVFAKPKVGKSTFARNLCLAVSRGEEFLGLKTTQGECIYLALEEREEDIRKDFLLMGADGSEPIYVHAASAPAEGIAALCDLVRDRKPILVVIDPLFRLAHIRDEKAYAETYAALGPLIDVARETGTHVSFTHHSGKGAKTDSVDSPLGSTAIGGAVSTLIVLKRSRDRRTMETVQRVRPDIPETILEFNTETHQLALGGTRFDAECEECEQEILEFLEVSTEPQTQEQIRGSIEGQTKTIRAALTGLVKAERVARTGDGKRGKPYLYAFPDTGSEYIAGTRKPELEKRSQVPENTDRNPVPEDSQNPIVVREIMEGDDTVRL
jgi:hypothetical protein